MSDRPAIDRWLDERRPAAPRIGPPTTAPAPSPERSPAPEPERAPARPLPIRPPEPPAPSPRPAVDRWLAGERSATPQQQLRLSWDEALRQDPDRLRRVIKVRARTGLPDRYIAEHLDELERGIASQDFDADAYWRTNPVLAEWLSDPDNAGVARDDAAQLSGLEWLFASAAGAWHQGMDTMRLGWAGFREFAGVGSPENAARMQALQAEAGRRWFGEESWYERAWVSSIEMLPYLGGAALSSVLGQVVGGGVGAAAGTPFGGVGALPGAAVGSRIGGFAGPALFIGAIETGLGYAELSEMRDELGRPLDPKLVYGGAVLQGSLSSALELIAFSRVARAIPGGRKLLDRFGTDAVKRVLRMPTARRAVTGVLKDYGAALGAETLTEVAQTAAQQAVQEAAKRIDAGDWRDQYRTREIVRDELVETFVRSLEAMAFLGGYGALGRLPGAVGASRRAEGRADLFRALGDASKASKLRQRSGDLFERFVQRAASRGETQTVRVGVEAWRTYWQSQNLDPERAAELVTGDREQYQQAVAAGGELVIEVGAFARHIAHDSQHLNGLLPDIRVRPGELTLREAQELDREVREQLQRELEAAGERTAESVEQQRAQRPGISLSERIRRQLVQESGYDDASAADSARVIAAFLRTMSARTGVDLESYIEQLDVVQEGLPEPVAVQRLVRQDATENLRDRLEPVPLTERLTADLLAALPEDITTVEDLTGSEAGRAWIDQVVAGIPEDQRERYVDDAGGLTGPARRQFAAAVAHRLLGPAAVGLEGALGRALPALARLRARVEQGELAAELDITAELAAAVAVWHEVGGTTNGALDYLTRPDAPAEGRLSPIAAEILALLAEERVEDLARALNAYATAAQADSPPSPAQLWQQATAGQPRTFFQALVYEQPQRPPDDRDGRGRIAISGRRYQIVLGAQRDLSTFLHESGHLFLEVFADLAAREDAPSTLREDWQATLEWLGAEPGQELTTEQHEKWARGFEAYLMEGKSPALELVSSFSRFRAWLIGIYRSIRGLDVELSDDVRKVFDRLLASDQEIAEAREAQRYEPLLKEARELGMTDEEYRDYLRAVERAQREADEDLTSHVIGGIKREETEWWRERRDEIRREVLDEMANDPSWQAAYWLRMGHLPEGATRDLGSLQPQKLDKRLLVARYGKSILKELPFLYAKDGGLDPGELAELFGFASGDELVQLLRTLPARDQFIEDTVRKRMKARHGDPLSPGTMAEAAQDAVHGEQRGDLLLAELRYLARRSGQRPPTALVVVRAAAERTIQRQNAWDLAPHEYRRREAQYAREAFQASAAQDWTAAYEAQLKRLHNFELYRAARAAKDRYDVIQRYLVRMGQPPAQARLGKAGEAYLDQVNNLLSRFELRRISRREAERRASLAAWVQEQAAQGYDVAVSPRLLEEAFRIPFRSLTVEDAEALYDAVQSIEHLARTKNGLLHRKGERDFDAAKARLIGSLQAHSRDRGPLPVDVHTSSATAKASRLVQKFDAELLKIEQIVDWMDGGNAEGPWTELLWQPIADAQAAEEDLAQEILAKLIEAFERLGKERGAELYRDERYIDSMGQSLTRQAMIAVALNCGSQSNYQRLVEGAPRGVKRWDELVVREILSHLDERDWQFVQQVWDTIDSLWPQVEALEKRLSGVAPPKVPAQLMVHAPAFVRGGYYPLVYDHRQSRAGRLQSIEATAPLFEQGYRRAMTPHGHTIQRVENFAAPIKLDLNVLPQHLSQVIHDLTHREAILSVHKLLTDPDVRAAMYQYLGEAYTDQFQGWLHAVANERVLEQRYGAHAFWNALQGLRSNMTVVAMGFKATTMMAQLAGFAPSAAYIGSKWLTKGLVQFSRDPRAAAEFVHRMSGEMRHRAKTMDRDLKAAARKMAGKQGRLAASKEFALTGIGWFDAVVTIPTWLGAYSKARAEGLTEEGAVAAADRVVRLSQGAGGIKDLAAIQRHEGLKIFTMFYSYFSALYGQLRATGRMARDAKDEGELLRNLPKIGLRLWWIWIVPALASELLAARGPDEDDDESAGSWAIKKALVYPVLALPGLREIGGALESGFDPKISPIASIAEKSVWFVRGVGNVVEGEKEIDEIVWPGAELLGHLVGAPTGQIRITGEYLWDLGTGEESPENPAELLRNLAFRRRED